MAGLKQIKSQIRSIKKTGKVTRAMESVSAAKMRKAQQTAIGGRAYARAAVAVLARVSGSRTIHNHPLTRQTEGVRKTLYIVITSDKGLAGALNSAVLRAALGDITLHNLPQADVSVIAVGRKANDFFTSRGYAVRAFHPNSDISSAFIRQLVEEAAQHFIARQVDQVKIVYQNFVSTFEQRPTLRTIFPLTLGELERVVEDIAPMRGMHAHLRKEGPPGGAVAAYTIEPDEEHVLEGILPLLAGIFVYHALLESLASEHSARMVAMKSASDKAEELEYDFTLRFNKARQAAITREVSEITGGMEAMAS